MPKLSVWWIRAALLEMGVGFLFGALILAHKGVPLFGWTWQLLPAHIELMIYGWTMQFVMGVGYFALPRFTDPTRRYGEEPLGWMSFLMLNAGVLLGAAAQSWAWGVLVLVARGLVVVSVLLYVRLMWARVKPFGSP